MLSNERNKRYRRRIRSISELSYKLKLPPILKPVKPKKTDMKLVGEYKKDVEYYIDGELVYSMIRREYIPHTEEFRKLTQDQASEKFFFHYYGKWQDIPDISQENNDIWNYYLQNKRNSGTVIPPYPCEIELMKKNYQLIPGNLDVYDPTRFYISKDLTHFIGFRRMKGAGLMMEINNFSEYSIDPVKLAESFKKMNDGEITIRDVLRESIYRFKKWHFSRFHHNDCTRSNR